MNKLLGTEIQKIIWSKMYKTADVGGSSIWACSECEYNSKYNHNVFEHIEAKHVGSLGYLCDICNKVCPTKNALRTHNIRHHKNK